MSLNLQVNPKLQQRNNGGGLANNSFALSRAQGFSDSIHKKSKFRGKSLVNKTMNANLKGTFKKR